MKNLDNLHSEQDKFIKDTFASDTIISINIFDDAKDDLSTSKIKIKKYTYKQKNIIIFLAVLLILSTSINVFLVFRDNFNVADKQKQPINTTSSKISNNIKDINENLNESKTNEIIVKNIIDNKIVEENSIENNNIVTNTNTSYHGSIVAEKTNTVPNNQINSDDVNLEELKELITYNGYGINRISFKEENLESNTILLFIAKQYFNRQPTSSINSSTKFTGSKDNFNNFFKESYGLDFSSNDYLTSYSNYIGYNQASKTYIFGKDYSIISKEKYTASDITLSSENDGIYTAKCTMTRELNDVTTNYDVTFTFTLNSDYTYTKYCIKTISAKNTSFYPDNTVHFIEN